MKTNRDRSNDGEREARTRISVRGKGNVSGAEHLALAGRVNALRRTFGLLTATATACGRRRRLRRPHARRWTTRNL
ncbi:hypothetical protein BVI2075_1010020 [Burkholderia vietnamiensis]|nr:hypothetical protein BVI2075_1010020 [Burkholderia vietnamiensis]